MEILLVERKTKVIVSTIAFILFLGNLSFAQTSVSEYLYEIGKIYYYQGKNDEALHEFKKALLADPDNVLAKFYVEKIEGRRKDVWDKTLDGLESKSEKQPLKSVGERETVPLEDRAEEDTTIRDKAAAELSKVDISGELRAALGGTSDGFEWKRANGDLNERNWRVISNAALNNFENTFDPRIFDRVRVDIDTKNTEPFGAHANITVDPWSFTGKSEKFTVTSANGTDTAEIELKYWSNTRRAINETVFTLQNGDSFALPEIKVEDERTAATTNSTVFGGTFNVPSVKIHREFQPVRELWFDYKTDNAKARFFPIGYSDQALTSDDPLGLSNHHIYWEESPWILRWASGHTNTGASPDDFSQGKWDDSLAFFTRDSDLTRLTALRGLSFDYEPTEETSFKLTGASPKGLWQDYDSFDNFPVALRLKQRIGDELELGTIYTYRLGLNEAQKNRKDALNHTWGTDFGFSPFTGIKLQGEIAASRSEQDLTSSFASKKRGLAYQLSLLGSPEKDILSSNYDEIKPQSTDWSFLKTRLQFTHMDEGFEPALATYRETRDDQFWSRHIHFRKPFKYLSTDSGSSLSLYDIMPFAIGDGVDIGRDVVALRVESSMLDRRLDELFDVRNVHQAGGKYLENVARSETTFKATEKLTTKLLAIYHNVHQTYGAKDPFLVDSADRVVDNTVIPDSKSASMKTFSLGANYDFFDWLSGYGIWEYSNDINAAYDAFPRGILNSGSFETFTGFGRTFRRQTTFLYNQYYFPLPPYPFNNTFKAGFSLRPHEKWELFLDFTRNEYEYAGQVSDDINHIGLEISYQPTEKLGFLAKYVFSQVNDLVTMNNGKNVSYEEHNNFFVEARYNFSDDEGMTFQFGEAGRSPVATVSYDPFGGSLSVLDTQHIYRASYRRRF